MNIQEVLERGIQNDAADIFLIAGLPLTFKRNGAQHRDGTEILMPEDTNRLVEEIYTVAHRNPDRCTEEGQDDDFSFAIGGLGRFRVNVFHQRGSLAAVIRVIKFGLPDPVEMNIPEEVLSLADSQNGLVLVAGAAGTGKTTTLACMIDRINRSRGGHIITMEDPIEFVHRHDRSIVTQREISVDTPDFLTALRSALRESPDVILLGEMRDYETMSAALTAAETGVLMFSTLHTVSAANTINRILDVFPANQQQQVKMQLSQSLQGIVCQQLLPTTDGRQVPAFEIMKVNPAIQNMIRDDKLHQMDSAIQAGASEGMRTMDQSLLRLYQQGTISKDVALSRCIHYEAMVKRLG